MKRYQNLGGDSSVVAYEYDATSIRVQFNDNSIYEYSSAKIGETALQEMKRLADAGRGLCSYINRHKEIRNGYSRRTR